MKPELTCPTCGSHDIIKHGLTRRAKQNHKCKDCERQFVEDPQWRVIPPDTKVNIDRLLLERVPLAGIVRVLQISAPWLQRYVNQVYKQVSRRQNVSAKPQVPLTVQMDDLWSFVDHKGKKQLPYSHFVPYVRDCTLTPIVIHPRWFADSDCR